ncbi:MAG TPA: hypothetical protein PK060_20625, partial [Polaromonas sp.]|uniref:hypothetical protein n=1 Tax=Polaromonas sp. TaxID=1869339 RepID=UPI002B61D797
SRGLKILVSVVRFRPRPPEQFPCESTGSQGRCSKSGPSKGRFFCFLTQSLTFALEFDCIAVSVDCGPLRCRPALGVAGKQGESSREGDVEMRQGAAAVRSVRCHHRPAVGREAPIFLPGRIVASIKVLVDVCINLPATQYVRQASADAAASLMGRRNC